VCTVLPGHFSGLKGLTSKEIGDLLFVLTGCIGAYVCVCVCVQKLFQAYPRTEREQHEEVYRGAQAAGSDSVPPDGTAS